MKRFFIISVILFTSISLSGCQQSSGADTPAVPADNPENPYPPEEAIENGDVVNIFGEITNLETFTSFTENFEAEIEDEIRITLYTVEGDPFFYNLNFDGSEIHYTYDDSQDSYAGSDRGIYSTTCSEINSENTEGGTLYSLEGCSSSDIGGTFYFIVSES